MNNENKISIDVFSFDSKVWNNSTDSKEKKITVYSNNCTIVEHKRISEIDTIARLSADGMEFWRHRIVRPVPEEELVKKIMTSKINSLEDIINEVAKAVVDTDYDLKSFSDMNEFESFVLNNKAGNND